MSFMRNKMAHTEKGLTQAGMRQILLENRDEDLPNGVPYVCTFRKPSAIVQGMMSIRRMVPQKLTKLRQKNLRTSREYRRDFLVPTDLISTFT